MSFTGWIVQRFKKETLITNTLTGYIHVRMEIETNTIFASKNRGGYSFLKRSVKTLAKLRPQSWLPLMSAIKKNPCE